MRVILSIIGFIGFILCMNEQPPSEVQDWWVNGIGIIMFGGAATIYRRISK